MNINRLVTHQSLLEANMLNATNVTNHQTCLIWDLFNYKRGRIQHDGYSTAIWSVILLVILFINISIVIIRIRVPLYCTNVMYVLALSTFLNQALFGVSLCTGEILSLVLDTLSCTVLKQIYFFQEIGQLSTILGIATLTFSQYKDVTIKQSTLNQMSKLRQQGLILLNERNVYTLLAFVWGFSVVMSALPIFVEDRLCLMLPSVVGVLGIVLYVIILCKFYILIKGFIVLKRQNTTQMRLGRSLTFLRMSGVLLALTWIPPVIARFFWFLAKKDQLLSNVTYVMCSSSIIFPICQPLLYSYVTPEIRTQIRKKIRDIWSHGIQPRPRTPSVTMVNENNFNERKLNRVKPLNKSSESNDLN